MHTLPIQMVINFSVLEMVHKMSKQWLMMRITKPNFVLLICLGAYFLLVPGRTHSLLKMYTIQTVPKLKLNLAPNIASLLSVLVWMYMHKVSHY
jgi:hypothetical protein